MTSEQIPALRRNIQIVNCSNCGAPIDLASGAACEHCRSPLSMLDMRQAESLIAQLRSGEVRATQPIDPALPLEMARARRDVERASRRWQTMKRGGGRRRGRVSSPPA